MKVFLVAGEASGDRLGAALMAGLRELRPDMRFCGVGGPLMQAEGLDSLFPMSDLSVMGLAEIIPRYPHLRRRLHQAADAAVSETPDLLVTIDSPDFCLRLARLVRARAHTRIVHYVAPSVWAWRPGRAARMAGRVDQVLAVLPFEPPYMEAAGVACDFVGHPVVSEPAATPDEIAAFRDKHALKGPALCVLPGSRQGEIARLAPVFGRTLADLARTMPDLAAVVPVAPGLMSAMKELTKDWPLEPVLIDAGERSRKWAAFGACDAALAASGTVSLELARAGVPMIVAYDMAWLSRKIISAMARIDTVTLVNLVSETRAVPEFIGARCRADLIAPALQDLLRNPETRAPQQAAARLTMERLGLHDAPPGLRAAQAILARL